MWRKANTKINVRKRTTRRGRRARVKVRFALVATTVAAMSGVVYGPVKTRATSCPDVKIIFARGSGAERYDNADYQAFRDALKIKLDTTSISYEIDDLDYPAIGVGPDHLGVTIGAFFSGGEGHEFGESMNAGVDNLKTILRDRSCPDTKYVLGGYSQGAMVIEKATEILSGDRLIYMATFGDPKIYLPEGRGLIPAACMGGELSNYRMHVPDCRAYKGILGANIPYEPTKFAGKVGTWCNKRDILCSSYIVVDDHVGYVAANLYEDAARVIFDKITQTFGVENTVSSPHDTVFLIDSTGSMGGWINRYKEEAYRLAKETLEAGGRVALYDYRDLSDPYEAQEHCNFTTCDLETFVAGLDEIRVGGGGDTPESLLSSSLKVMNSLEWKLGSTKSLVVLTDANFLSPDRDGTTLDQVVALSKTIDPVNFYVITQSEYGDSYAELAERTDGLVVTDFGELDLLTDYIMDRYDSLPRVEEDAEARPEVPTLSVTDVTWASSETVRIEFENTGSRVLVALNDAILGITEGDMIEVAGLNRRVDNTITLVPLGEETRGEGVDVMLDGYGTEADEDAAHDGSEEGSGDAGGESGDGGDGAESGEGSSESGEPGESAPTLPVIPKAPDTGRVKIYSTSK